jgi:peptide/nickel transport system permease protein
MKHAHKNHNRTFWIFFTLAVLLILVSLFSAQLAPHDPNATDVSRMRQPPSAEYPFGTDAMGRCVLSRVLCGARTSIFCSLALVLITAVFGSIVGIACGYYSGALDQVIMRIIDGIMAFPQMVLAIAVAGILGGGMRNAMLALGFASWTPYARLARSRVIAIKQEDFVTAARISGCSDSAIMRRYIFPNIFSTLLTYATSQVGTIMLGFAGLSFLNLGVQLPNAEWGSMISEARGMLATAPWTVFYPALALVVTVMVFNYLGDALRDRLDVHRESGAGQ